MSKLRGMALNTLITISLIRSGVAGLGRPSNFFQKVICQ